eukprot:scaffold49439_cov35-Tisochrysis_lutea.AAC.3
MGTPGTRGTIGPITLLQTDYKILAKVLANRLNKMTIHTIVSREQVGFVPRRMIGEEASPTF